MKTKPLVKEFIRFGVVGVLATALHYGIYWLVWEGRIWLIICCISFC